MSANGAEEGGAERPRSSGSALRIVAILAAIIRGWALLGGCVIALLSVMTAASAVSNILFAAPFAADYELVKNFVGVAIFMFLPYCQLAGANVTVDIFTEGMSEATKAAMALLSSLFAFAFSALLLRQMSLGFLSYMRYPEVTPVLHLPLWTAFPPILLSLFLLLVAALLTALDGWRKARGRPRLLAPAADLPVE